MVQTGSRSVLKHLSGRSNSALLSDFCANRAAFTFAIGHACVSRFERVPPVDSDFQTETFEAFACTETIGPINRPGFPPRVFSIASSQRFYT